MEIQFSLTFFLEFCIKIYCCILTFDPAKHAIPKMAEVHIPLAWASLADNMGQGKISRYSHRLMHWKRVTCELHDSYFRSWAIELGEDRKSVSWRQDVVGKATTQQKGSSGPPIKFGDQTSW